MGFLDFIFNSKKFKFDKFVKEEREKFDKDAYDKYNEKKIKEFTDKYDLTTREGINSIPILEAQKYPNVNDVSVVYMPEQILNRKATEYKKEKKYDLAIECLKKANELYDFSPFAYQRTDYERVVDIMILAGRYSEAKQEHKRLDSLLGSRLDELKKLQNFVVQNNEETREDYQKRVINPYLEEKSDREEYYWLLENMLSLAPKSFGGYRRMKKEKTENYKKIANEVNKLGYKLDKVTFWY